MSATAKSIRHQNLLPLLQPAEDPSELGGDVKKSSAGGGAGGQSVSQFFAGRGDGAALAGTVYTPPGTTQGCCPICSTEYRLATSTQRIRANRSASWGDVPLGNGS